MGDFGKNTEGGAGSGTMSGDFRIFRPAPKGVGRERNSAEGGWRCVGNNRPCQNGRKQPRGGFRGSALIPVGA